MVVLCERERRYKNGKEKKTIHQIFIYICNGRTNDDEGDCLARRVCYFKTCRFFSLISDKEQRVGPLMWSYGSKITFTIFIQRYDSFEMQNRVLQNVFFLNKGEKWWNEE